MTLADRVRYSTVREFDNRPPGEMTKWYAAQAEARLREVAKLSAANYRRAVEYIGVDMAAEGAERTVVTVVAPADADGREWEPCHCALCDEARAVLADAATCERVGR